MGLVEGKRSDACCSEYDPVAVFVACEVAAEYLFLLDGQGGPPFAEAAAENY